MVADALKSTGAWGCPGTIAVRIVVISDISDHPLMFFTRQLKRYKLPLVRRVNVFEVCIVISESADTGLSCPPWPSSINS